MKLKIVNNFLQIIDDNDNVVISYDLYSLSKEQIDKIIEYWENQEKNQKDLIDYIQKKYKDKIISLKKDEK